MEPSNNDNYLHNNVSVQKNAFVFKELFGKENKELILLGLLLFSAPLIVTNQLVIGTIVNALLIKSAIDYKTNVVYLLALIPSIAVFASGILFGGLTQQILFVLPAIWLGNFLLMFLMRKIFVHKKANYFISVFCSAGAKTIIIFSIVFALFSFELVPIVFLTSFGLIQFLTAISGASLIFLSKKLTKLW